MSTVNKGKVAVTILIKSLNVVNQSSLVLKPLLGMCD